MDIQFAAIQSPIPKLRWAKTLLSRAARGSGVNRAASPAPMPG